MINKTLFCHLFICATLFPRLHQAQNIQLPLNNDIQYQLESEISPEESFHSSIKPYYKNNFPETSLLGARKGSLLKRFVENKLGTLNVYPIPGVQVTSNLFDKKFLTYYFYGFGGQLSWQNKWAFGLNYFTGEFCNTPWVDTLIKRQHIMPGIGLVRGTQRGYSARYLDFYFNFKPSNYFLIEAGRGKSFIGDGYRSLLLSDNAAPFPYFKVLTNVWKFSYLNLWNVMQHYDYFENSTSYSLMAVHYLSFKPNKYFTFAFFESEVYANRDSSGKTIRPELSYFNPVVFYRPIEYSLGSADNALMGFNFKFQISSNHQLYSQIAIDEFNWVLIRSQRGWWGNKHAFQMGYKWLNIFRVKGFGLQLEGNYVRPYTYSHALALQNYSHLNQPLAHPTGANFTEALAIIRYQKNKWMFELFVNQIKFGDDLNGRNYGGNIFRSYINRPSDFNNKVGQGLLTTRHNITLRTSYYIWPKANISIDGGVVMRSSKNANGAFRFNGLFIGISSKLVNSYQNF